MVVPTVYGFDTDTLYLHGSVASQRLNTVGTPVCVTVTLTDGLVLARSVFEHSINYRSAMICGRPRAVTDPAEKLGALRGITEYAAPGQWNYARRPSRKELAAARVLALPLDEASVRSTPAHPTTATAATPRWACGPASCHWPPPGDSRSPTLPFHPASPSPPYRLPRQYPGWQSGGLPTCQPTATSGLELTRPLGRYNLLSSTEWGATSINALRPQIAPYGRLKNEGRQPVDASN
jgi:nitroimidazol reductase NimA-like FMN-containing flavoprotein (pyridoxamine 5'-phosphate oxidase superfamily)